MIVMQMSAHVSYLQIGVEEVFDGDDLLAQRIELKVPFGRGMRDRTG